MVDPPSDLGLEPAFLLNFPSSDAPGEGAGLLNIVGRISLNISSGR
jgi:hypothetical protein